MVRLHLSLCAICFLLLLVVSTPSTANPVPRVAAPNGASQTQKKSTLQLIRNRGSVVIAYTESSIPFSYIDSDGKPIGYAIELCRRVVDAIRQELKMPNLPINWLLVKGEERLPSVIEGKADLECGATTNTADRRKQVAFTMTHYFAGGRLLVKAGSPIKDLWSFRGQKLAAERGSTYAADMQARIKRGVLNAELVEATDDDEAMKMLRNGEIAAYLNDDIILYGLRALSGTPTAYAVVGAWTSAEPLAIMLRRDDAEFKRLVDTAVARTFVDGEGTALYRRWFNTPIPKINVSLDVPMSSLLQGQMRFPTTSVGDAANE